MTFLKNYSSNLTFSVTILLRLEAILIKITWHWSRPNFLQTLCHHFYTSKVTCVVVAIYSMQKWNWLQHATIFFFMFLCARNLIFYIALSFLLYFIFKFCFNYSWDRITLYDIRKNGVYLNMQTKLILKIHKWFHFLVNKKLVHVTLFDDN